MKKFNFNFMEIDDEDRYCTDAGPFTGEAFTTHRDGWLHFTPEFKNGFKDGLEREFHADGTLAHEGTWFCAHRIGVHRSWYEDGTLKAELDCTGAGLPTVRRFNSDGSPSAGRRGAE